MLQKIKTIFSKLIALFSGGLSLVWKIGVPILLVGLIVTPVALSLMPKQTNNFSLGQPVMVEAGDISKRIISKGTIEFDYSYDLPVYQDATLLEVMVNEGDRVEEGQVLAKLEFVNQQELRDTDIQNQINSYITEINNQKTSLGDTYSVNDATINNLDTQGNNIVNQINDLQDRIMRKDKENREKRDRYQKELDQFESLLDNLEQNKNITDSIRIYEDQKDELEKQLFNQKNSSSENQIKIQINSQELSIQTLQSQYDACLTVTPAQDCSSLQNQLDTARDNLDQLERQLDNADDINDRSVDDLRNEIDELDEKIQELKDADFSSTDPDLPIVDSLNSQSLETQKSELRGDIANREAWIRAIDESVELENLDNQLKDLKRTLENTIASRDAQVASLNQQVSNINQRLRSAQTNLSGANEKLSDVKEDIEKQLRNEQIIAKKAGIVGKVFKEQGLPISSRESQFTIVSEDYILAFDLSADLASQVEPGMPVKLSGDKYDALDDLTISSVAMVPNSTQSAGVTGGATEAEYRVEVILPKESGMRFAQGEEVDSEIILEEVKDTLAIPTTAVFESRVYVGNNPIISQRGGEDIYRFESFEEKEVELGLDNGRTVQVKSGLSEGDYIFSIYPRNEENKQSIQQSFTN